MRHGVGVRAGGRAVRFGGDSWGAAAMGRGLVRERSQVGDSVRPSAPRTGRPGLGSVALPVPSRRLRKAPARGTAPSRTRSARQPRPPRRPLLYVGPHSTHRTGHPVRRLWRARGTAGSRPSLCRGGLALLVGDRFRMWGRAPRTEPVTRAGGFGALALHGSPLSLPGAAKVSQAGRVFPAAGPLGHSAPLEAKALGPGTLSAPIALPPRTSPGPLGSLPAAASDQLPDRGGDSLRRQARAHAAASAHPRAEPEHRAARASAPASTPRGRPRAPAPRSRARRAPSPPPPSPRARWRRPPAPGRRRAAPATARRAPRSRPRAPRPPPAREPQRPERDHRGHRTVAGARGASARPAPAPAPRDPTPAWWAASPAGTGTPQAPARQRCLQHRIHILGRASARRSATPEAAAGRQGRRFPGASPRPRPPARRDPWPADRRRGNTTSWMSWSSARWRKVL